MLTSDEIFEQCWLFIRGDMTVELFERWIYETGELEASFSEDFYMTLISTDYTLDEPIRDLKQKLKSEIHSFAKRECECHTLPDLADVGMGQHQAIFKSLSEKAKHGAPLWWLWLAECSVCGECWMVGSEERINDVFLLKRLSALETQKIDSHHKWPDDFKEYSALLKIGRERGHSVQFIDLHSPVLVQTVIELATVKPGIGVQEISNLLQVDRDQARHIVKIAIQRHPISVSH